jgi:hypothetical protein
MSGSISATTASTTATATTSVAAGGTSASSDAAKERAQLASLLRSYQSALDHGQSADSLKSLAKQIADAAKQLGQNVSLPKASNASASTASTPSAQPAASDDKSKVDLTT